MGKGDNKGDQLWEYQRGSEMSRTDNHITETKSKQIFATATTGFSDDQYDEGDLLFREQTERDYGIDGEIELFQHGDATGRIAKIQLKGTEKTIDKLKTVDAVSCSGISKSNLSYCRQKNYPVMLVYVSTADDKFYYIDLQSVFKNKIPKIGDKESGTVRIPIVNSSDNLRRFVDIINSYYEESDDSDRIVRKRQDRDFIEIDYLEPVDSYEFIHHQTPADGEHREVNLNGDLIAEGLYKDGKLLTGTEYDYLIHVTKGKLIYKPDCPEDPYDATDDFKYERMEPYGWEELSPFGWSLSEIEHDGLDKFYVVDMEVTEKTEHMTNIRTLEEFLEKRNPQRLECLRALIKPTNSSF